MFFIPESLPINDQPPQTDAEWDEALKEYGRDREDGRYRSTPSGPSRQCRHTRALVPRRGMEGSDSSDAEDIEPSTSMKERKKRAFGHGGTISSPPVCCKSDEDQWDGEGERKRMRDIYDREGWLHGTLPSLTTKRRRRRVIRRLGLAGAAGDDHERRTIISQYMDMAKLMFEADDVGFAIYREDVGYKYSTDPDADPTKMTNEVNAMAQYAIHNHAQVTVIGDLNRDWRTRRNPLHKSGYGMKFMAAVPLLYLRSDPPVTFGCLVILGREPRTIFTEREQAMLIRLSGMIVYQLATFQSELSAEKAATMYEKSLAFLRRSVMPSTSQKTAHTPTPRTKNKPDLKTRRSRQLRPHASEEISQSVSPIDSDKTDLPPLVVKSGPKDQLDATRKSQAFHTDLYQDAADTLRGFLGADALSLINMEEYQLYYRKNGSSSLELDMATSDPANLQPVLDFLSGEDWPSTLLPVVHHVPTSTSSPNLSLAHSSTDPNEGFDLKASDMHKTICELMVTYIQNRKFWWRRDDEEESLGERMMFICPPAAETLLVHFMITADGRIQHLMLATWNRPPSSFADSSALALPFIQILGGLSFAALNFRKVRAMESSKISYSNLQAHELRTPLHQILAITQLLRSAMLDLADAPTTGAGYTNSLQQIRDLIPILDAIDTSGTTLHGIVDNILSFLDLKNKDAASPGTPKSADKHNVPRKSLLDMLEEVIEQAHGENERSRRSIMQSVGDIETIFEVDPPTLGTDYLEDRDGSLRRALGKILSNAYKFIDGHGCVSIKLSTVGKQEDHNDCHGVCLSEKVLIEIRDNGPGMDTKFVQDHLGEPWAKQDAFTTGSGLSVHLAYRIIDMMGGHMEVHSAPGRGCLVRLEVPVPRVKIIEKIEMIEKVAAEPVISTRKIAIVGFNIPDREKKNLSRLGDVLRDQYKQLGAEIVDISEADLVIANGEVEEAGFGRSLIESVKAGEIVFLTMPDHTSDPEVAAAAERHSKLIRRIAKPITPSVIRRSLLPRPSRSKSQHVKYSSSISSDNTKVDEISTPPRSTRPEVQRLVTTGNWRPAGMCVEEAIANLSLGDYFSCSRQLAPKTESTRSSMDSDTPLTPSTSYSGSSPITSFVETPITSMGIGEGNLDSPISEFGSIKVLVVEDNNINRKILVKILSKMKVEIIEAADGVEAVERFSAISGSIICLLDINMPKKDGFQACEEMRALERNNPDRIKAEIIAVTALSAEAEKERGWKVGFDEWAVKPCGKNKITSLVETARKRLLGIVDEPNPDQDIYRRYTT